MSHEKPAARADAIAQRDRFGQHALYFARASGALITASCVWSLLEHPGVEAAWDPEAAALALLHALPPERTLFRGIGQLPPGAALRLEADGPRVEHPADRSAPPYRAPLKITLESAADELLVRLERALAKSEHDEPACALSGGLDSGALLALMSEARSPIRAFSLADDALEAEEKAAARALVSRYGAEHVLVQVRSEELPEHFENAVRACETLLWNGRAVARWLFFRGVRAAGAEHLVSGTGADEILLGHPVQLRRLSAQGGPSREVARGVLTPDAPMPSAVSLGDSLLERRHFILDHVLPESTLPPETRSARASRVDVHLPFLDDELAGFALTLPHDVLVRDDTGKRALRHALRGRVSEALRTRPKRAVLAQPGGHTPRVRRAWRDLFADWLTPTRLMDVGPISAAAVARLQREWEQSGSDPKRHSPADAVLLELTSLAMLRAQGARLRAARGANTQPSPAIDRQPLDFAARNT